MKEIIAPIERGKIMAELTPERFLRHTNKGGNEIYVVNYKNAPYTMQEIGRLREIAFRSAGGGTGKEVDIDMFDTMEKPCQQLIVWDPDAKEILGGYRFILGEDMQYDKEGRPIIAISHMFDFSPKFIREYMPHTIELGRSFVSLEYQSTRSGAKGLFALDNLWDGLGALVVIYPQIISSTSILPIPKNSCGPVHLSKRTAIMKSCKGYSPKTTLSKKITKY